MPSKRRLDIEHNRKELKVCQDAGREPHGRQRNGEFHCDIFDTRLKKSNKMQLYGDIYLQLNYSTCFGRPSRPSSGVRKTVVAASGTDHTIWGASLC